MDIGKYIRQTRMTVSSINSYNTEFYDSLTSPFTVKRVYVNSNTPYEEPDYVPASFSRYHFGSIKSTTSAKLMLKTHNVGVINLQSSSANIVKNMISDGYSAKNAIDMQKAVNAYGFNALNSSGVSTLSSNIYEV